MQGAPKPDTYAGFFPVQYPVTLQRYLAHIPHQTSYLRSLRRLRNQTEVLAPALAGIVPVLLSLPWLLLELLLWLYLCLCL